jgi:hypothetical protein
MFVAMRIAYISTLLFVSVISFGQAPQRFSFQAVVRHPDTSLVTYKQISVRLSILKGDINGTVVYSETHSPRTNGLGLFTLEVGGGTVQSGDFSSIDWGNDSYFIKREIDPTGGTNYSISGTSQMLSVPYALHAQSTNKINKINFEPSFSNYLPKYKTLSAGLDETIEIPTDKFFLLSSSVGCHGDFTVNNGKVSWIWTVPNNSTIKIISGSCSFRYQLLPLEMIQGELVAITIANNGIEKYTVPTGKVLHLIEHPCIKTYSESDFYFGNLPSNNNQLNSRSPLFSGEYFKSGGCYPEFDKITIVGILEDI